jgi:gliding motility-associated-like protein
MKHTFTLVILLFLCGLLLAQKEYHKWYFGGRAAMDFVPGSPVTLANNAMNSIDNPATMSDSLGNLLFYSNGLQVWNRNHAVMGNGTGLLGDNTGGHTATAVKQPGSNNIYYLFTMDNVAGPDGLRYSVIDMNLNAGLGGVVTGQKNILVLSPASEQVIPVIHSNGTDIWIVTHPWNSSSFHSYLLTCNGLSTTPVVSTVGAARSGNTNAAQGQITVNATNDRIATANWTAANMELFDFNNSTGVLSNPLLFTGLNQPWGLEFSPNGSKLYLSGWTTQYVSQYDLTTYTQAAIAASVVNLGNVTGPGAPYFTGYMQRAPDGKIYIAVYLDPFLGVINNPDAAGLACNLVDNGYNLGGKTSGAGLPDKVVATYFNSVVLGSDTTYCGSFTRTLSTGNANTLWSTGVTAAQITVTTPGTYWASIVNGCSGGASDTIVISQNVAPVVSLGNDTTYCGSFTRVLSTGNAGTSWSTGVTAAQITVNTPGTYTATISNGCGSSSDNIVLTQNAVPVVNLGNDTALCTGQTMVLNAGNAGSAYQWQDNSANATFNVSTAGTYAVTVTNAAGCSASDAINVTYTSGPPIIDLGNDTTYCGSFTRVLATGNASTVWSTGVTAAQITVTMPGTYSATVSNGCGSATDAIILSQNALPVVNLGNDTSLCTGQTAVLDAGNAGATYQWQDNSTNSTFNVSVAGNYTVTVTNASGCSASDAVDVGYVSAPPVIALGNDTTYCGNFLRTLNAGNPNTLWSTGVTSQQINATAAGIYWAQQTNACGTTRDSIQFSQLPVPSVSLGNDTSICNGQTVQLTATSSVSNFLWSDGSSANSLNVSTVGTYWVEVDLAGCKARDSVIISTGLVPVFNLGFDTTVCGDELTLLVHAQNAQYQWQDLTTDSFYRVTASGIYSVTVSNACGSATDEVAVDIERDRCAILVPTGFSPNNDGANDVFRAISRCPVTRFSMHVYNRWGEEVFTTDDVTEGWNGVFRDKAQPLSVYVYYIDYFNYCEQKMKKVVGNVTLVR